MEALTTALREIFEQCARRGMVTPFVVVAASKNGSVLALRVSGEDVPDVLAEHYEGSMFSLPITIMVLDQTAEAARVTFAAERTHWH